MMEGRKVKEEFRRLLGALRDGYPEGLEEELLGEGGELVEELILTAPRLLSVLLRMITGLAERAAALPPERMEELASRAREGLRPEDVSAAVNAVSRLIIAAREAGVALLPHSDAALAEKAMRGVDYGKLRKALIYRSEERLEVLRREVLELGENPLALVNLFSVAAPALNRLLGVLEALFGILQLPAEAMTYALWKILEDIDWRGAARVLNGAARLVVTLHRGNLILGDGAPHSREVAERIASDLLGEVEPVALAEALAALAEEGSVVAEALALRLLERPELLGELAEALAAVAGVEMRLAAAVLDKAAGLPEERLARVAAALREVLEEGEIARAAASLRGLSARLEEVSPGLRAALLGEAAAAIGVGWALSPSAAAERANRALAGAGRERGASQGPSYLKEFFAGVDFSSLEEAAGRASSALEEALRSDPRLAAAVLKVMLALLRASVRAAFSRARERLLRLRGGSLGLRGSGEVGR